MSGVRIAFSGSFSGVFALPISAFLVPRVNPAVLMNRYGYIRFAQVPEQVSNKGLVILIIGNSKSNHLGAQGTFKLLTYHHPPLAGTCLWPLHDIAMTNIVWYILQ